VGAGYGHKVTVRSEYLYLLLNCPGFDGSSDDTEGILPWDRRSTPMNWRGPRGWLWRHWLTQHGLGPVAEGVVVGGVVAGLGEASGVSRVVSSHHVIKPEASGAQDRRTR